MRNHNAKTNKNKCPPLVIGAVGILVFIKSKLFNDHPPTHIFL